MTKGGWRRAEVAQLLKDDHPHPSPTPPDPMLLPEAPLMAGSTVEMKPCESVWVGDSQGEVRLKHQNPALNGVCSAPFLLGKVCQCFWFCPKIFNQYGKFKWHQTFFWRISLPFDTASMNWSCRTFLGQFEIVSGEWVPIWDPQFLVGPNV